MADNIFGSTAISSQDFDGGWHTFGALAEVSEESNLVGGRAFFPNPKPANFLWVVFRVSDESIIAQVDLAALAGTSTAAWNDFDSSDFDVPGDVALDPAEQYIPAVVTNGDFRFLDSGVSYPYGAGIVTASEGRFHNGGSGAVFPTSTSSSVVFGADMLVEAAGSEPSEVTLTTAVVTLAAQALTATPGVVTVALTPATYTLTAITVTATPGVVTVALTTAVVTLEAQALTATPGSVTVALTPAVLTLTASTLTATPGVVTVALTAAVLTLAAQALAAAPGLVTTALTPAVLTLTAVQLIAGEPGTPTVWRAGRPEAKWNSSRPESKWSAGRPEGG